MVTYQVIALKMGSLTVDKASLVYGFAYGERVTIPVWAAAIEGGGHRILVDTGIADPEWVEANVAPCRVLDDETVPGALRHIGWQPEDVDIVINTHLHYDHCGWNRLFPHGRLFVSAKEWEGASDPIPSQRGIYDGAWREGGLTYFHYTLTGDHHEVLPGVRLLATPGHSVGHQSVLVHTEEGTLAVSGDAINLIENLERNLPPGILYDTEAAYRSMQRLRRYAEFVLTGHDVAVQKYQSSCFPRIR